MACTVAAPDTLADADPFPMPATLCERRRLLWHDLRLCIIKPVVTATDPEQRYRCPVQGCLFLGSTISHASDCLKHLVDPKYDIDAHSKFCEKTLVCFLNADGKPALHSKPAVPAAFSTFDAQDPQQKTQHAYMKVDDCCPGYSYALPALTSELCADGCLLWTVQGAHCTSSASMLVLPKGVLQQACSS